jgi:hypothetical protein
MTNAKDEATWRAEFERLSEESTWATSSLGWVPFGGCQRYHAFNAVGRCPANARTDAGTISALPNIGNSGPL